MNQKLEDEAALLKKKIRKLEDDLVELSGRIKSHDLTVLNEAATKSYFIAPFLRALGYDPSNPDDVIPEFTADVADKKGEKVDYAIKHLGSIEILVECKPAKADLGNKGYLDQLQRYFDCEGARFSILTNGLEYRFFSDFVKKNRMDVEHFFEFDMLDFNEEDVVQLVKFSRGTFDKDKLRTAASLSRDRRALLAQFRNEYAAPSKNLVELLGRRLIDDEKEKRKKKWTGSLEKYFSPLVEAAFHDFVRNKINDTLTSAMKSPEKTEADSPTQDDGIVTTEEEIETYMIVRAICAKVVDPDQVTMRDKKSFCSVLFENNGRKPILKMYYTEEQKNIGIWLENQETQHEIARVTDLHQHEDALRASAQQYLESN